MIERRSKLREIRDIYFPSEKNLPHWGIKQDVNRYGPPGGYFRFINWQNITERLSKNARKRRNQLGVEAELDHATHDQMFTRLAKAFPGGKRTNV